MINSKKAFIAHDVGDFLMGTCLDSQSDQGKACHTGEQRAVVLESGCLGLVEASRLLELSWLPLLAGVGGVDAGMLLGWCLMAW
jgi:hypothetical protein